MTAAGVSLITTIRNGDAYLPSFLANLRSLTGPSLQFVVVDDRSTDATSRTLERAARTDERFTICSSPEPGRGHALNRGIEACRFDLVAIQDVDDLSVPWRFDYCARVLGARQDIDLLGSGSTDRASLEEAIPVSTPPDVTSAHLERLQRVSRTLRVAAPFAHSSVIVRRAALEAIGGYDVERRSQFDYDLYIRLAVAGRSLYLAPVPLALRMRDNGSWFEGRARLAYRLRTARLQYRALREIDGPATDWLVPPIVVAGAFVPRKLWSAASARLRRRPEQLEQRVRAPYP